MTTVTPTRRVDRGRGHSYLLDGQPADGVTWVLGEGYPKPALIGWAANETAAYAVDNWDDLAEMKLSARLALLKKARYLDVDKAARRGTEVHKLAQRLAAGEEVEPPEELVGHVDAYLRFVEEWEPEEFLVEAVVGSRNPRYMGTLDFYGTLNDGRRWLLDWKTSRSGIFPESALQLSAYRRAEFYLDANAQERPMPEVDATGAIWLRADGTYEFRPLDTSDTTFQTFLLVQYLAHFVKDGLGVIGEDLRPTKGEPPWPSAQFA